MSITAKIENVDIPDGYDPSDNEEYMNPLQLSYFYKKLMDWKEELLHESQETLYHLKEENTQEPDSNDRASVESERSLELKTRNRYRKLIDKIDAALHRIEDGSYGYCEETGEKIGVRRLLARPIATLCIEAQERHESYERNHIDDDDI